MINTCIKNNIQTQVLPGPTAFVPALVNSGFDTTHFHFYGFLKNRNEKGEFVIIISKNEDNIIDFSNLTLNEHYNYYKSQGFSKKEIIKKISTDLHVHKSEIYKLLIDFD